jgi:hypothetical protein
MYYTAHVTSHTAVPLELRNSNEVNSHPRILPYPLGTDHAQKTQPLYCMAQTRQKARHMSDCKFIGLFTGTGCCADDTESAASSIVACWTVFTDLLPGNVLIKFITIYLDEFPA